jgi:hypothetical protein
MTRLMLARLARPTTANEARLRESDGSRTAEELAGRTVWCAAALPGGRASAEALRACLLEGGLGPAPAAEELEVTATGPPTAVAALLDDMLGGAPGPDRLGAAEDALCAECAQQGEALIGEAVGRGDVVIVCDVLSALLADAVRERGAHAVWHLRAGGPRSAAGARRARSFLAPYTHTVDAYIMTWPQHAGPHGEVMQRVAAMLPGPDVLAATEVPAEEARGATRRLAWQTVLADVVHADREEHVGGTVRPRPAVTAR